MAKRPKKMPTRKVPMEALVDLAGKVCPIHNSMSVMEYRLTGSTRMWRCKDGSWTARFVYRGPENMVTMTSVVRGIVFA